MWLFFIYSRATYSSEPTVSQGRQSFNALTKLPPFILGLWSEYSKEVWGQFLKICLKIAKKCWLYLHIFSCVLINTFHSFLTFRLKMHVRCDNQYKTWADGKYFETAEAVWVHGYLRFEPCTGKWIEGLHCLCTDCKILISLILFKFSHNILDWTALSWN